MQRENGLHHSFQLNKPVPFPLTISLSLVGITDIKQSPLGLIFHTPFGPVLEYNHFAVIDALGKVLKSKMYVMDEKDDRKLIVELLQVGEFPLIIA